MIKIPNRKIEKTCFLKKIIKMTKLTKYIYIYIYGPLTSASNM